MFTNEPIDVYFERVNRQMKSDDYKLVEKTVREVIQLSKASFDVNVVKECLKFFEDNNISYDEDDYILEE